MTGNVAAIIITHNEEKQIGRCLASLAFARERIVVDAESHDRTVLRAKQHGATVFTRSWTGYGDQKNFGAAQATAEWLLFIDADEVVTLKLQKAILQAIQNPVAHFYWLRIVTVFLGKPLYHLFGHNPRLYRRGTGRWTADPVHEQVMMSTGEQIALGDTHSRVMPEVLLHYSHVTVAAYLKKMHRYTTLDAARMHTTGTHRSGRAVRATTLLPVWLSAWQLFKLLFYRRGILDGYAGMMWCVLSAYYEWEMGRKFLNLTRS